MITVRFPSGFSVQYNDLDHANFRDDGVYLTTKGKPNNYSVWVPRDCIIEHVRPCRTYDATKQVQPEVKAALDLLSKEIRSLKRKLAKRD